MPATTTAGNKIKKMARFLTLIGLALIFASILWFYSSTPQSDGQNSSVLILPFALTFFLFNLEASIKTNKETANDSSTPDQTPKPQVFSLFYPIVGSAVMFLVNIVLNSLLIDSKIAFYLTFGIVGLGFAVAWFRFQRPTLYSNIKNTEPGTRWLISILLLLIALLMIILGFHLLLGAKPGTYVNKEQLFLLPLGMIFLMIGIGTAIGKFGTIFMPLVISIFLFPLIGLVFLITSLFHLPLIPFVITILLLPLIPFLRYLHHYFFKSLQGDFQIQTAPGHLKPFTVSISLNHNPKPTNRQPDNGIDADEFSAQLEISCLLQFPIVSSQAEHQQLTTISVKILSASFQHTALSSSQYTLVLDTITLAEDITHPATTLSKHWGQKEFQQFEQMPAFQDFSRVREMANAMAQALKGGPEAANAAQQVKSLLSSFQLATLLLISSLAVKKDKKQIDFSLPSDLWGQSGSPKPAKIIRQPAAEMATTLPATLQREWENEDNHAPLSRKQPEQKTSRQTWKNNKTNKLQKPKLNAATVIAMVLLLFLWGALFISYSINAFWPTFKTEFWEKVPITNLLWDLEKKKIEYTYHPGGSLRERQRRNLKPEKRSYTDYTIATYYEYTYHNHRYKSGRFSYFQSNHSFYYTHGYLAEVKNRYPGYGFVNPANPSECVLVKGINPTANVMIPVGVMFLMLIISIIGGLKKPLYFVPIFVCFIFAFINGFLLTEIATPTTIFYFNLLLISLSILAGWYWTKHQSTLNQTL